MSKITNKHFIDTIKIKVNKVGKYIKVVIMTDWDSLQNYLNNYHINN